MKTGTSLAVLVLVLPSSVARALPPPKTETEMMQMADLVVDAECVTIICDGVPVEDAQKITTTYLSTLWPSQSYKGGLPNSFQIRGIDEQWKVTPPVGGWHQQAVPKGWVGKLYLTQEADGTYTKVWWNAMEDDTTKSAPQPLPTCAAGDGGPPLPDATPLGDVTTVDGPPVAGDTQLADLSPVGDGPAAGDGPAGDGGPLPDRDDGCSCHVATLPGTPAGGLVVLLLTALLTAVFRRRRKH
jgi:hypothetical protein